MTKIETHDSEVIVTTAIGDTYRADVVVVTVSLGILKAGLIQFDPPLESFKQAAIEQLGNI